MPTVVTEPSRGAGYAYAIYQRMIDQSLKRRIFVDAQENKFVQCVSPKVVKVISK
ncbi:MAG: hypothetical protein ACYTX0_36030 [Nostoc sp.]